jgi:hypothetical protein
MLHREPLSSSFFLFLSRTTETKQRFILPLRPRGEALPARAFRGKLFLCEKRKLKTASGPQTVFFRFLSFF